MALAGGRLLVLETDERLGAVDPATGAVPGRSPVAAGLPSAGYGESAAPVTGSSSRGISGGDSGARGFVDSLPPTDGRGSA